MAISIKNIEEYFEKLKDLLGFLSDVVIIVKMPLIEWIMWVIAKTILACTVIS